MLDLSNGVTSTKFYDAGRFTKPGWGLVSDISFPNLGRLVRAPV